jgi:hypothetical protein
MVILSAGGLTSPGYLDQPTDTTARRRRSTAIHARRPVHLVGEVNAARS